MADLTGMLQAAAGAAGGENLYIEDVFSTYLYTGTGSAQTITNGIDLAGEGGMVWTKFRSGSFGSEAHAQIDTVRGGNFYLSSNSTIAQVSLADLITSFNSNGYTLGADATSGKVNYSAQNYASWTFRKAPKFFDCVTYTGTGSARTVSHNLGSVPGCIIVKRTDSTGDWIVYHRANTANPETDYLELNDTAATADDNTMWNDTAPTSTEFTVGTDADVNGSTNTYVAYLFAHDAGGFGDDGSENVITCGSFTQSSAVDVSVSLGYEPQWLLVKQTNTTGQWNLLDDMRGFLAGANSVTSRVLRPNLSNAEANFTIQKTATGFTWPSGQFSVSAGTYIYIAIRRGPMKTPESGTEVYNAGTVQNNTGRTISPELGYPVDWFWNKQTGVNNWIQMTRLIGVYALDTTSTAAEVNYGVNGFDNNKTFEADGIAGLSSYGWMFRRAPGFFDVVCYTGTGSATTISHNLGVVPELIIVKKRSATDDWAVYAGDNTDFLLLNTTAATADDNTYWNDTSPTSTVFSVGTNADVNTSAATYVAYLFASLAGVSKVGSYTGNGTSVTVTTGFQPRFILVKRTDSTGNWIVGDSARGLVAGDDPYLLLNSTAAEVTNEDWVDISATGFTINETAANANVNTATYIYLAIS